MKRSPTLVSLQLPMKGGMEQLSGSVKDHAQNPDGDLFENESHSVDSDIDEESDSDWEAVNDRRRRQEVR